MLLIYAFVVTPWAKLIDLALAAIDTLALILEANH